MLEMFLPSVSIVCSPVMNFPSTSFSGWFWFGPVSSFSVFGDSVEWLHGLSLWEFVLGISWLTIYFLFRRIAIFTRIDTECHYIWGTLAMRGN